MVDFETNSTSLRELREGGTEDDETRFKERVGKPLMHKPVEKRD